VADYTSTNLVYNDNLANAMVNAFGTRPGAALLASPTVMLYNLPGYNPTPGDSLSTLTAVECDFAGYSRQSLTLTSPVNLGAYVKGAIGTVTFQCTATSGGVNSTATGYALISAGLLQAVEQFSSVDNVPFAQSGDFLVLNMELPMQEYQSAS
jgi:hypothetical protein